MGRKLLTDCYEGLTTLQELRKKQQNKEARNADAASESDSSRSSRGGCVVREFDGPALIGGNDEVDASDDAAASEQEVDSDSESQGTSGSEVAQYDPEEFHYRPRIPNLPNDLKRVPPQKLTEMFEAMRNHDESALKRAVLDCCCVWRWDERRCTS